MKVALLQFDTKANAKEENFRTVERLLEGVECDLVALPEMFSTGYDTNPVAIAEEPNGATVGFMRRLAEAKGCAVVGSVATHQKGKFYNRMYVCLPNGDNFHYDKRHLFTFAGEDKTFSAGKERIVVEWRGVRILPLVCYDLRFPAWSYLPSKVDLILYSAAWSEGRIGAWDRLLPARAVENQAWAIGVNRVGIDPKGTRYNGHSAAYDFFGEMVATCGEGERVEVVEIVPQQLETFRNKFRAWQDADNIEIR